MNGHAAMTTEGITYRQLDASWMARLVAAGLTLDAAHWVAREAHSGACELAPGIVITLDAS